MVVAQVANQLTWILGTRVQIPTAIFLPILDSSKSSNFVRRLAAIGDGNLSKLKTFLKLSDPFESCL